MRTLITHKKYLKECKLWVPGDLKRIKKDLEKIIEKGLFGDENRPMSDITTHEGTYIVTSKTKGRFIPWRRNLSCRGVG